MQPKQDCQAVGISWKLRRSTAVLLRCYQI